LDLEQGKIVSITDGKIVIKMDTSCEECHTCGAKHACGALVDDAGRRLEIPVTEDMPDLHEGDRVALSFRAESRIFSAFIMFIFPLLFMIAGYFVGFKLYSNEGTAILISIISLIISIGIVWGINKILYNNKKFIPSIYLSD